ncbi:MAG: polysaccharide biosynthesis protein, partial [Selenomonadaceae bacterium]|nr:polysaccharide biosynthesis protein [Selenomonadaceae bacterium]
EIPQLLKTMGSAGVMAVAVKLFYDFTMAQWNIGVFSTFGAVFFGCAVYLLMLILIGGIREEDVQRIPMIGRIFIRAMRRIGVFKSKDEQEVH